MTDILKVIDTALGCQHCGQQLPDGAPSGDFCDEDCQCRWHAGRADTPPIGVDQAIFLAVRDALGEALRRLGEAFEPFTQGLQEAGLVPDAPPKDPKARALYLQHRRNTGPKQTQWSRRGRR